LLLRDCRARTHLYPGGRGSLAGVTRREKRGLLAEKRSESVD